MNKPRFVLDTNLIVSAALLGQSVPRQAFELALSRGELLLSDAMQVELSAVLKRNKFNRYVSLETRLRFLAGLLSLTTPVTVTEHINVCRDPKDNKVLELAVSGKADCIVTGDGDLLVLNPFRDIPILTPVDFLATSPKIA
jgi:putative PIN family toxin of toxin-antitoxin system